MLEEVAGSQEGKDSQQVEGPQLVAASATKWEYTELVDRGRMTKIDIDHLNEQGELGWELLCIIPVPGSKTGEVAFYFKRPKQ